MSSNKREENNSMSLHEREIREGVVAYFDPAKLNSDPRIQSTNEAEKQRPYVCFCVSKGRSAWAPLTSRHRPERIEIRPAWRFGGTSAWKKQSYYLNDGKNTCVGDNQAFVDAASQTDKYKPETRQKVAAEGIAAIKAEVKSRHGLTCD
jgi:hypothetical protein